MDDREFESRVHRFEQARRLPEPCEIADYLEGARPLGRTRLLVELLCIDLEYRWRNPRGDRPATLAEDVVRFPELGGLDALPIELIGEEYRARQRWGDRPSHADFLASFRDRRDEIRQELCRIDEEIEAEMAEDCPRSRDVPSVSPLFDTELLSHDDFLLRRLIGAGRTGKVFEATYHEGGGEAAVKFLRRSLLHEPEVVRRFIEEARTIARLRHPNIVGTRGLGRTPGGSYFIVMDLVDGPNLATVASLRAITSDEAVRWTIATCEALEHAHVRGIAHCDLKPANLLLDGSGLIRVTDFGLARSLTDETPSAAEVEGTAPFMAPEQASRSWGQVDHRTDVYGIGAVLYTLLTGRPPFVGRRLPDILAQVISAIAVVPPSDLRADLPGPLSEICRKCLSKAPDSRYQAVGEVRRALESIEITGLARSWVGPA